MTTWSTIDQEAKDFKKRQERAEKAQLADHARKFYVEYKYVLTGTFNHSFQNLRSIVCWNTKLQQDDEVQDITQMKRTLKIQPPQNPKDPGSYTRFFLDDPYSPNKIEVVVLKLYLKERLQLEFKLRDLSLPV